MSNPDPTHERLSQELLLLVAREGMVDVENLKRDAVLADLDIISADFIMILMAIEEEYGAYISVDSQLSEIESVGDLMDVAIAKILEHQKESLA
jgi:acyl carrier protein